MSGPAEEPILLVAVSARMLAELAVGAGHDVVALDRFGDLDLQRLCRSVSVLRDLGGRGRMADLVEAADGIGAPSVVYGAGLENQPALVERLARGRRLLGTPPEALERVRDPAVLGASLRGAGFSHPPTFRPGEAPRGDRRRWLRKPVLGGGGRGIREWRGGALRGQRGGAGAHRRACRARRPRSATGAPPPCSASPSSSSGTVPSAGAASRGAATSCRRGSRRRSVARWRRPRGRSAPTSRPRSACAACSAST